MTHTQLRFDISTDIDKLKKYQHMEEKVVKEATK